MTLQKEHIVTREKLIEREKLEFKRDNSYFWFVFLMMLGFVFIVGVAVWHYFF